MPAKTKRPTQEEMKTRIARFKDLKSTKAQHGLNKGMPPEVLELITAKTTYNIMSPAGLGGQLAPAPPVVGGDAGVFRLGIVTCPPGNGAGLHAAKVWAGDGGQTQEPRLAIYAGCKRATRGDALVE
ncbi:MAG TPA: hypothetical protein VK642_15935 [Burkholderiales bacterium]|nr:hypothetical protein [Burkholderiales bacterium]